MVTDAIDWRGLYAVKYAIDPHDIERIALDFSRFLSERGLSDTNISTVTATLSRDDGSAITTEIVADVGHTVATAHSTVSGLLSGVVYHLTYTLTVTGGLRYRRSVVLECQSR